MKNVAGVDEAGRRSSVGPVVAASVIAEVYRDSLLVDLHKDFPHYGWVENFGYLTKAHKKRFANLGFANITGRRRRPLKTNFVVYKKIIIYNFNIYNVTTRFIGDKKLNAR